MRRNITTMEDDLMSARRTDEVQPGKPYAPVVADLYATADATGVRRVLVPVTASNPAGQRRSAESVAARLGRTVVHRSADVLGRAIGPWLLPCGCPRAPGATTCLSHPPLVSQ